MSPLDVAVIGAGPMGAHHARTVARHPGCRLVAVVDTHPGRAHAVASTFGAEGRLDVPDGVDAVIVATPTHSHAVVAAEHLRAGRWVLVEKPFTRTSAEAQGLLQERCVVAHVERFNPAVRAAGALIPRYVDARRLVPFRSRGDDVCVIRDLMVHDLDLFLTWCGCEITRVEARGLSVRTDEIDVASATLHAENGAVAQLLASRIAAVPERLTRVFEARSTTWLDLLGRRARRGSVVLPPSDARDGLTAQWDAFVSAALGEEAVAVRAEEGLRVVALAERIREVMRRGDRELERAGRAVVSG